MSTTTHTFKGKVSYVMRKANDWGKFTMNFYPPTAADRKAIKETGVKNKTKEDDGAKSGVEGLFYTFRNSDAFPITLEGKEFTGLIGNGSEVELTLEVETFKSPVHGPQARSKVTGINITSLIPYDPEAKKSEASAVLPA